MAQSTESMTVTNVSHDDLRERVKQARRDEQQGELLCCDYLLQIDESRCYLTWGYASTREFADRELFLTPRQTGERLRVARALAALPALRTALDQSRLCFSVVREITRVATRATEDDWVRAASQASARDVERMVAASTDGKVPERVGFGLPRNLITVAFQVSPSQLALLEAAQAQMESETGARATLAAVVLRAVEERWHSEPRRHSARVPRRAVPQLAYVKCPDCERGAVSTEQGMVPVSPGTLAEIEREACEQVVPNTAEPVPVHARNLPMEAAPAPTPAETPSISPRIEINPSDSATSHELRAAILARDGHRCRVPGCGARRDLQVHHVRWRRFGGQTHEGNLVVVCNVHHGIIHAGHLMVSGVAPHRLSVVVKRRISVPASA